MAIYEYKCKKCGYLFEIFSHNMSPAQNRKCPECNGEAEKQVSKGVGIMFKGSGFYVNDYKKGGGK